MSTAGVQGPSSTNAVNVKYRLAALRPGVSLSPVTAPTRQGPLRTHPQPWPVHHVIEPGPLASPTTPLQPPPAVPPSLSRLLQPAAPHSHSIKQQPVTVPPAFSDLCPRQTAPLPTHTGPWLSPSLSGHCSCSEGGLPHVPSSSQTTLACVVPAAGSTPSTLEVPHLT